MTEAPVQQYTKNSDSGEVGVARSGATAGRDDVLVEESHGTQTTSCLRALRFVVRARDTREYDGR